jgi:AraC family transcriptional regulator
VPISSNRDSTDKLSSGGGPGWLGNSVWRAPQVATSGIKSWSSFTAVSYSRADGEGMWRGDRHRLVLTPDHLPPVLMQIEQGPTQQMPAVEARTLGFYPAGLSVRAVEPAARRIQVVWEPDMHSGLLPELGSAASRFEFEYALQDPLLSQIVTALAEDIESGFADRILIESLGTALYIRIARHFIGHLQLPTRGGLSPERLRRVRDYVDAHLDEDLSLTMLAEIACLSPYHFSRSFKQAVGVGPQRYVIQRRIERAKTLMRRTHQPLALIALEAGFTDRSHLTSVFRREIGMTPGRFRAELA